MYPQRNIPKRPQKKAKSQKNLLPLKRPELPSSRTTSKQIQRNRRLDEKNQKSPDEKRLTKKITTNIKHTQLHTSPSNQIKIPSIF